ncbi:hypothetical protein PICSAR132_01369 [Mycobacterium avium subsp. paratuberculosis]|nr:hypothetical protein PICSAR132_01369 [Mycobacterium avium subsp. paratuberculosis]CAG7215496.1 hypothetical protein PICSAR26_00672 [Mycobacterium avium subsp. paratuberculosis]CAG7425800.1 hypothetical protein PICSAR138_04581 [Mycobacterium avium subsp. paratuberculosis]
MTPGSPAGTSQPCCQPLTAIGVSRAPLPVRATHPGLMLSGMTRIREVFDGPAAISRRSGPQPRHDATRTGWAASAAAGVDSSAPSTTNWAPGLINSSCWPAGSAIGSRSQGTAATGWSSSRAPTVVWIAVCTNRPATAMTGPRSQPTLTSRARLRPASAGPIGLPSAPSAATSASPGGLSWSKPNALRSMTSSQSSRLMVTVSVTRGLSGIVCA